MEEHPRDKVFCGVLHGLIEKSSKMALELSRFKTAQKGTYEKSYDFLVATMQYHVQDELMDMNRDALVKAKSATSGTKPRPAMPVTEPSREVDSSAQPAAPATALTRPGTAKNKSSPCYAWQRGTCKRGDKCAYSHSGEPGSAPALTESQKKDLAEKRATQACRAFAVGQCRFGDKCQYQH